MIIEDAVEDSKLTLISFVNKHVDFVKEEEEEEIAKIRMLNAQPGLHMGIAKNTRITCKKNAQKLAKFAEKN